MQRVLRRFTGILPQLFIFSVLSLMAGFLVPENPFAIVLGIAGFYGLLICVYVLIMHAMMFLINLRNGDNSGF